MCSVRFSDYRGNAGAVPPKIISKHEYEFIALILSHELLSAALRKETRIVNTKINSRHDFMVADFPASVLACHWLPEVQLF